MSVVRMKEKIVPFVFWISLKDKPILFCFVFEDFLPWNQWSVCACWFYFAAVVRENTLTWQNVCSPLKELLLIILKLHIHANVWVILSSLCDFIHLQDMSELYSSICSFNKHSGYSQVWQAMFYLDAGDGRAGQKASSSLYPSSLKREKIN